MKTYRIHPGKREDLPKMPAAKITVPLRENNSDVTAEARLCYDDEALYVMLSAKEKDIRAENHEPLEQPCEDSCLEFFFRPEADDPRYLNIEFNLNGLMFLGIGSGPKDLIRLCPMKKDPFAVKTRRNDTGWEVDYAIPHAFVRRLFTRYTAYPGKEIRGNFYTCADLTDPPHYLTWNPVKGGKTFHKPEDFGKIVFL